MSNEKPASTNGTEIRLPLVFAGFPFAMAPAGRPATRQPV
jgi:hypothetical protein